LRHFPESDWKKFKSLREKALQRFCERAINDLAAIAADESLSYHQRYLKIFGLLEERDEQMAAAFNELSRSRAMSQLRLINSYWLLEPGELDALSSETRDSIELL